MRVLDLFCGCGGFSTGFLKAGHTIKYAIDGWKGCQKTYEYNHPDTEFILCDVKEEFPESFKGKIDVVIGGPPCQDLSRANSNRNIRKGMDLIFEFIKWIKIIKPKYWLMENVPDIRKFLIWKIKCDDFRIPLIKILNCADFGVPQSRERCFSGKYKIPMTSHSKQGGIDLYGNKVHQWRSVFDALKDIMYLDSEKKKEIDINLEKTQNNKASSSPQDHFVLSHVRNPFSSKANSPFYNSRNPSRTITNSPQTIINIKYSDAINNKEYPITYPSKTIRQIPFKWLDGKTLKQKGNGQAYFSKLRPMTVQEQARLQSFPDDFRFFGCNDNKYKMIGNAVPPLMSYKLATAITLYS